MQLLNSFMTMRNAIIKTKDNMHAMQYGTGKHGHRGVAFDDQQNCMPEGVPHTIEQALAEIDEGEKEFEENIVFSHEQVMQTVWAKIYNYAD